MKYIKYPKCGDRFICTGEVYDLFPDEVYVIGSVDTVAYPHVFYFGGTSSKFKHCYVLDIEVLDRDVFIDYESLTKEEQFAYSIGGVEVLL